MPSDSKSDSQNNPNRICCDPTSGTSTAEYVTIHVYYSASSSCVGDYSATITVEDPNVVKIPLLSDMLLSINTMDEPRTLEPFQL